MRLLGGDIGGTKVNLAVFEAQGRDLRCVRARTYPSGESDGLVAMLEDFLGSEATTIRAAAFGVAGPVQGKRARITNLPWVVDADELRELLETQSVALINDLEATAWGVLTLRDADMVVLNEGKQESGTRAVIAAGTGLGEALLFWDGSQYHAAPSEGGHTDFGPRNELEVDLLAYLRERFGRVSYERIVSGSGLVNVYEFLRDTGRNPENGRVRERFAAEDPAAVISDTALTEEDPLCTAALHLFVAVYGAEAGNLALKSLSNGGIYVAGGIAPKILGKLRDGTFMESFLDKGRMRRLVERMPVRVVMEERTALNGAGAYAARLVAAAAGTTGNPAA